MQIKKVQIDWSSSGIFEQDKYLLPTVIFVKNNIGNLYGLSMKLVFWKWWIRLFVMIQK